IWLRQSPEKTYTCEAERDLVNSQLRRNISHLHLNVRRRIRRESRERAGLKGFGRDDCDDDRRVVRSTSRELLKYFHLMEA
ncbi:hypothetical protein TSAR_015246, partial [Trichomalopsis sarcophagae]